MSLFLKRPLFFFDGTAAGGGNPPPGPDDKNPPNAGGNGGADEAAKAAAQADLNRQFAERATRAAEAERTKLWESLGVKTQEEFDALVKAKKDTEDANKTALEKLEGNVSAEKTRADKAEAEKAAADKRVLDTEIKLLASRPVLDKDGKLVRAAFRADALDDVAMLTDRKEIKDEEGKFVGIDKALDALAKAKPWMLDETKSTTAQPIVIGTPVTTQTKQTQTSTEVAKPNWTL